MLEALIRLESLLPAVTNRLQPLTNRHNGAMQQLSVQPALGLRWLALRPKVQASSVQRCFHHQADLLPEVGGDAVGAEDRAALIPCSTMKAQ